MREPQALITPAQLHATLGQADLRIYDCTTYLEPPPPGSDDPYVAVPGRATYEAAHIPGSDFLDLQGEFSDATTRLRFMMPPVAQLETAFGRQLGRDVPGQIGESGIAGEARGIVVDEVETRCRRGRSLSCMTAVLDRPADSSARARPGPLLAVLLLGQFMAILDVAIVNVAAPTLRSDLHASGAGLQLSIARYTISYAVVLITGARLGDRFGHGRAFRAGLVAFTGASLLCGLAPTTGALIAFRLVQGVGAALMMPQVMSLIQRNFAGPARARALSLYSAVIACGSVIGQVLGGVLVSADLFGTSWRPVFLVNVPIGIVLLVLAGRLLPADRGERARQLDPAGVLTLSVAVLLLVVPLVLGHEENWPVWGWVSLGASAFAFAGFVVIERRLAARGGAPLVSGRVLRAPGLVVGAAALFVAMINYGGYLFAMALHLQSGLGESPAHAGLVFAPVAVGFAATGLTWRLLPQRLHGPMIPFGMAVADVAHQSMKNAI